MSLESLLIHRATISRNSPVSDGAGGYNDNLVAIAKSVPCRVRTLNAHEMIAASQRWPKVTSMIYFLANQDITEGDIVRGTLGVSDTYRVANVTQPSKTGHHLEVRCEQLQPQIAAGA